MTPDPAMGIPFNDRTTERDEKALEEIKKTLEFLNTHHRKKKPIPSAYVRSPAFDLVPIVDLSSITARWDDKVVWELPAKEANRGAAHRQWGGVGYPADESLRIEDFEEKTHIDRDAASIKELEVDLHNIKTRAAKDLAGSGVRPRLRTRE